MNISIVGSGYVGLITATGLAIKGHDVACIDVDKNKVDMINRAEAPFYEDKLNEVLHNHVIKKANLKATTNYETLLKSDITFICVNTSSCFGDNADFTYVRQAMIRTGEILKKKEGYHIVVTKSSVIPGTTDDYIIPILEKYSNKRVGDDIGMAVNPEFLQEGRALSSFLNPDRVIIGEYDKKSGDVIEGIYQSFNTRILRTEMKTAEMIKFSSNAFLATKISFINEIGNLCKALGIDVYKVAEGIGYDPRIGRAFLNAGIGFGGSCLPKDLDALLYKYKVTGEKSTILSAVANVNKVQPMKVIEIVKKRLGELTNRKIAILGLTFKPDTDDIRNAPAIAIVKQLLNQGAQIQAYDPKAMQKTQAILSHNIQYGNTLKDTIEWGDIILILTEWDEFKDESMYAGKMVLDGRRVLDPEKAKNICKHYEGVCW